MLQQPNNRGGVGQGKTWLDVTWEGKGGAAAARAPAQHQGRTSSAPAGFVGGFSAPLGWR